MAQQTENVDFRLSAQDSASPVFRDVQKGLDGLAKQAFGAKAILATLGAAVSAQQFVSMVLSTTEVIGKYKDLGEIAGTTAEKISGLEVPARLAGLSLDSVAASVAKLGKSIGEARLGDVGKRSLLQALGIDPDDGRDAAEIYVDVARAVSGMKDQTIAGKVASDLLGKSFAELRVFMRELTEQGGLVARVTNEQADAADRFGKDLGRISLKISEVKQAFVTDLLPGLNSIVDAMVRGQKEGGALTGILTGIQTAWSNFYDQKRNDKEIFELTEKMLDLEQRLAKVRTNPPGFRGSMRQLQTELEEVNAKIKTTLAYRKLLEEARTPPAAAGSAPSAGEGGTDTAGAEARVRERMEFEKHYAERVAAARGFATRYGDAIQLQNQLAQEAGRQGVLNGRELIQQVAANEDARLQVLVWTLNEERALHVQKGDLAQAQIAQDKAAAAESARIANEAITQARLDTPAVMEERRSAQAQIAHEKRMEDLFQRIVEENMTERDLLTKHLDEKRAQLEAWAGEDLIRQQIANEQLVLLEIQHQAKLGSAHAQGVLARRDFEQRTMKQQTQIVTNELLAMTQSVANYSRLMFNINKVAGIANAIINTHEGVTKALAKYPPPLSFVMAAAQLAAGMAQVQQIRNASFGGATSAPTISGGTAVPVTPIEGPPTVTTQAQPLPVAAAPRSQIFITVQGEMLSTETVRDLIKEISKQATYGAEIVLTT